MTKKSRRVAKARRALLALSLVLVTMMVAVGGTIAWLTDTTEAVQNTFTIGNIDIDLVEDPSTTGGKEWTQKLIPGEEYDKNPVVTVKANSEDCYLFVKVEQPTTIENILEYTLFADEGWTQGKGTDGVPANVWYRTVNSSTTDLTYHLLKDDKVKVSENLTNQNMPTANLELTFTAYAVQTENLTVAQAWGKTASATEWKTGTTTDEFGNSIPTPTPEP